MEVSSRRSVSASRKASERRVASCALDDCAKELGDGRLLTGGDLGSFGEEVTLAGGGSRGSTWGEADMADGEERRSLAVVFDEEGQLE